MKEKSESRSAVSGKKMKLKVKKSSRDKEVGCCRYVRRYMYGKAVICFVGENPSLIDDLYGTPVLYVQSKLSSICSVSRSVPQLASDIVVISFNFPFKTSLLSFRTFRHNYIFSEMQGWEGRAPCANGA